MSRESFPGTVPNERAPRQALEIHSASPLEERDRKILESHHADLADLCGEKPIPAEVIVADRTTWEQEVMREGLAKKRDYTGSAIEVPAPAIGLPHVLLPGPDVFAPDSQAAYKLAYEQSDILKQAIAEHPEEVYRAIYLEDIAGHELSHLYQFTKEQRETLAGLSREPLLSDPVTGEKYSEYNREYSKALPLREFTACLYGLERLFSSDAGHDIERGFLEANSKAESMAGYPGEQATRTMASASLLAAGLDRDAMRGLFKACRGDEVMQLAVQKDVERYVSGELPPEEFIGILRRISHPEPISA